MFYEKIVELVGEVPVGSESVVYVLSVCILTLVVLSALNVLGALFKWVGGK